MVAQQCVTQLQKQFECIEIGRALVDKGVSCIGKTLVLFALLLPFFVQGSRNFKTLFTAATQLKIVFFLALFILSYTVAKWVPYVFSPIRHRFKVGVVCNPFMLYLRPGLEVT